MEHKMLHNASTYDVQTDYFHTLSDEEKLQVLREMIDVSSNIVFFGGAGTSTECGLPDFRSKNGLYNTVDAQFESYTPEYLLSRDCLYYNPKVFFSFYRQKMDFRSAQPTAFHYKLAELEKVGKLRGIITQNIDGIHQKAGNQKVYEIHGTTYLNRCVKCNTVFDKDFLFNSTQSIPTCPHCGRMVRPDITLYGESLPKVAVSEAYKALDEADMLIVAGTSLTVEPAASMIWNYNGPYFVIINQEHTNADKYADLVFHCKLSKVFASL